MEVFTLLKYIGKRFIYMIITLFVIVTATFFLMQAAPGVIHFPAKESCRLKLRQT